MNPGLLLLVALLLPALPACDRMARAQTELAAQPDAAKKAAIEASLALPGHAAPQVVLARAELALGGLEAAHLSMAAEAAGTGTPPSDVGKKGGRATSPVALMRSPLPAPSTQSRVLSTMAAAKKKPKIQANDVVVGSRTLEGVLIDLAEQMKVNADRSARAEELATIALQTIAAVTQDLRALAQRTDDRLGALEKAIAAE